MTAHNPSRRTFLKSSAMTGGMLLTVTLPGRLMAADVSGASDWCVYVTIHPDNSVSMASPVMEMGQHMKTTGPMMLAEELDIVWEDIRFLDDCPAYLTRNGEGDITYQYSDMGTGGSHAVRRNWDYMRRAGATARRMLIEEAAALWRVDADALITDAGYVTNPATGKRLSYGYLAEGACQRNVSPDAVRLKSRQDYRIMGTDRHTVDLHDIVTGKPLYGIDADYPGALQAMIFRVPACGGSITSFDRQAALAVPGVTHVVKLDAIRETYWDNSDKQIVSEGIAVIGKTLWAVMQGKRALKAKWQGADAWQGQSSHAQQAQFRQMLETNKPAEIRKNDGDVDAAFAAASQVLDQVYDTPLFAHACMEPFNCIADIREDSATVVVGHQFPDAVAKEVEALTGIDGLQVEVISKRMGGGFGRRFERDFVREAILLSRQINYPVKVTWTREDEIERDYFAPAYVMQVRASLDDNNQVSGWHHRQAQTRGGTRDDCFPRGVVANYRTESITTGSKIHTGPWRGPAHMQWTFAVESMTDELAHAASQDPLAFRLAMMTPHKAHPYEGWGADVIDSGRMAHCYERAAQMAGWGRKLPSGHGLGIAGHFTFGSYAAFVLEVSVSDDEKLTLVKAWGCIDCGFAINPNHVRNQMEGGFLDGLSTALFNDVDVVDGQVINNNFHTLRFMRMAEAPIDVEVDIAQNDYPPTGVGEPPTAPAAAALANAIFAASGKRIRSLPIAQHVRI